MHLRLKRHTNRAPSVLAATKPQPSAKPAQPIVLHRPSNPRCRPGSPYSQPEKRGTTFLANHFIPRWDCEDSTYNLHQTRPNTCPQSKLPGDAAPHHTSLLTRAYRRASEPPWQAIATEAIPTLCSHTTYLLPHRTLKTVHPRKAGRTARPVAAQFSETLTLKRRTNWRALLLAAK